jgi:Flp pilus assembly protein protease CpaA
MSTSSIISMIVNNTLVIGGFIYFLIKAIINERKKTQ